MRGHRSALGGAGVEFAVGKSARAALAEAVVGLLDHAALAQDGREIEAPGAGVLATFQDDGFHTVFQTAQRGEHARRAAADDDDASGMSGQGRAGPAGFGLRRQRPVERDIEPELHLDRALPGVDRVLAQFHAANAGHRHAEFPGGGFAARAVVLRAFERQDDIDGFDGTATGRCQARIGRFTPASSTLTKVTRVEKIGCGPAFSSITSTV
jgi:hypothetical protein